MTVSYTPSQDGYELITWNTGPGWVLGGAPARVGGLQFTIPAPNELLFRSLTLTIFPGLGPGSSGTLSVGLCNNLNMAVFGSGNLPTSQSTIPVYSSAVTLTLGSPKTIPLSLGVSELQAGSFIGGTESAMQVLGHSSFQGNVAFVITFSGDYKAIAAGATLVGDETPFLTGLPTTKRRYSRADWCPRCGQPIFREQLIKDGYTKSLVCSDCYDRAEQRYPMPRYPKEINS